MSAKGKKVAMAVAGLALVGGAIGLVAWLIMKKKPDVPDVPPADGGDGDGADTGPHEYTFTPGVDKTWFPTEKGVEVPFVSVEAAKAACDARPDCVSFTAFKGRVWYRPEFNSNPPVWAKEGKTYNPAVEGSYDKI